MKYLFYDVECATCKNGGKMSSFGYVLTDNKFKILEKDDILINPNIRRKEYDWYVVKNILSYTINEIERAPILEKRYPKIKDLLINPNHISFGLSVGDDIRYIKDDCVRSNLPILDIKSLDIQSFYKWYKDEKDGKKLSTFVEMYSIDESSFLLHNSRDDAEMTMLVTKEICNELDITIEELIEKYSTYKKIDKVKQLQREKIENEKFDETILHMAEAIPNINKRESICILKDFDKMNSRKRIKIVKKIFKSGYNYTSSPNDCNYLVSSKDDIKALNIENTETINIKQFYTMIGI